MTERSISPNLQKDLKKIWGEKSYTRRMLFGPPLTINNLKHDHNPGNENNKLSDFNQDNNESSYFTPAQKSTGRILKRSSYSPK